MSESCETEGLAVTKKIPITVQVSPDLVIEVPGWMLVFALALAGVPWAVKEVEENNYRERLQQYERSRMIWQHSQQTEACAKSLKQAEERLRERRMELLGMVT